MSENNTHAAPAADAPRKPRAPRARRPQNRPAEKNAANANKTASDAPVQQPRRQRPQGQQRPRRAPQRRKPGAVPVTIYPLGGLGEVGKNLTRRR